MNRHQRRSIGKQGEGATKYLQSPCTITEAAQIARGVAEDVVFDYSVQQRNLQIAMSIQVEILKDVVINAGLITEDQFREMYVEKADEFTRRQMEAFQEAQEKESEEETREDSPKMSFNVSDIEVKKD